MNQATPLKTHLVHTWPKMVALILAVSVVEIFCHFHSFILEALTCFVIWKVSLSIINTLFPNLNRPEKL